MDQQHDLTFTGGMHRPSPSRRGVTLLELLAVITILGLIAAIILPRFLTPASSVKRNACYVFKGEIEVQAQLWLRETGNWPAADLNDIAADPNFFPEGLPTCPVDGTAYTFDNVNHRVVGHTH